MTTAQIAEKLGLSVAVVSATEQMAIKKLRLALQRAMNSTPTPDTAKAYLEDVRMEVFNARIKSH